MFCWQLYHMHINCHNITQLAYTPLDAGIVTLATLGSPNITPCDIAAAGTSNLTVNCKSICLTGSRFSQIGSETFMGELTKNLASLTSRLKNGYTIQKLKNQLCT